METDKTNLEFDDIDDELLAIPIQAPSIWYGIITGGAIVFLLGFMFWFWSDLSFFLKVGSQPVNLEEVADLDMSTLENNSYVAIDGLPLVTRSLKYDVGGKWFAQTDTSRKIFPLMGKTTFFVQWAIPEKDKKYRDPKTQPGDPLVASHFEGRLVRRDKLPRQKYMPVWTTFESRWDYKIDADKTWLLLSDESPSDKIWVIFVYAFIIVMLVLNAIKLRHFLRIWKS